MSSGTQGAEQMDAKQLVAEITGKLNKARTLLAMAHRLASKMPLAPDDQAKSKTSLAEAIGLCVEATRTAKQHDLYRLLDSALNPSEIRHAVERGLRPSRDSRGRPGPRGRTGDSGGKVQNPTLLAQLNACRAMNAEGIRWLSQPEPAAEDAWRGNQLLKIAEQLCVITALESKLLGVYVMGDSRMEPARARQRLGDRDHATRDGRGVTTYVRTVELLNR